MPAAPRPVRARRATGDRGSRALAVAAVVALAVTGCQSLGAAADVVDRADLVGNLGAQLDRSAELTYSAEYQLPGGGTGSIAQAQRPRRAAYTFPGGKVTIGNGATAECRTAAATVCTLSAPPPANSRSAPVLAAATGKPVMVAPAAVAELLTSTTLDAEAAVEQHDTTVAGRHATCVDVREATGASRFVACVTTDGVLGSFKGTVGGQPAEVTLVRYRDAVEPSAFDLPRGAKVVDRRPR